MEPPKYDGTIHQEEWVKQIRLFCQLRQITTEQEILKIFEALRKDKFFTIYKNDVKRKLSSMRYILEKDGGCHIKFMKEFLSLCYNAEIINEINKVKKYLNQSLKNNQSLQDEFVDKMENTKSMDELVFASKTLLAPDTLWIIGYESSEYVTSDLCYNWKFRNAKSKEKGSFVKSQDIINIHLDFDDKVVRSHEITFKVGNEALLKVIYHNEEQ
ncbi:188_t:CDS:2 [Funneliformis geosporum]|uniref:10474_t:CDS:1 n=1 Tax=Funneliformis geosporum TaxID=1117311 RepID=A0A9W4SG72_9GLOM|nr:10474_t:CDS:2 [Funneliformis geosporum]CAI2170155.1 188_t:CDS:2 [Funneliformis geosporum]